MRPRGARKGARAAHARGDADLQLHLDDVALLLLGELEQVHHHEGALVVLHVPPLGTRGHHQPVAARHELIVHEGLDDVAQARRLVDAVDEDDDGADLPCLKQHHALVLLLGEPDEENTQYIYGGTQ